MSLEKIKAMRTKRLPKKQLRELGLLMKAHGIHVIDLWFTCKYCKRRQKLSFGLKFQTPQEES